MTSTMSEGHTALRRPTASQSCATSSSRGSWPRGSREQVNRIEEQVKRIEGTGKEDRGNRYREFREQIKRLEETDK